MSTTVKVREDCELLGSGHKSCFAGKIGQATNDKPWHDYEVVVRFDKEPNGTAGFMWSELEVIPDEDDSALERGLQSVLKLSQSQPFGERLTPEGTA